MDRFFCLIEYFLVRIIALEVLYACMHTHFTAYNMPLYYVEPLPSTLFIQYAPRSGWYTLGDCCTERRDKSVATNISDVCFTGPYTYLFHMAQDNTCRPHLKYGRSPLYIH